MLTPHKVSAGVMPIHHAIDGMRIKLFWICILTAAFVFFILIYSLIRHRKSKEAMRLAFHQSIWVELIWTVIPFLMLVGMAMPAVQILMRVHDVKKASVDTKITDYRSQWQYNCLGKAASLYSHLNSIQNAVYDKKPNNGQRC